MNSDTFQNGYEIRGILWADKGNLYPCLGNHAHAHAMLCSFILQVIDASPVSRKWLAAVTSLFMIIVFLGACIWVLKFYNQL